MTRYVKVIMLVRCRPELVTWLYIIILLDLASAFFPSISLALTASAERARDSVENWFLWVELLAFAPSSVLLWLCFLPSFSTSFPALSLTAEKKGNMQLPGSHGTSLFSHSNEINTALPGTITMGYGVQKQLKAAPLSSADHIPGVNPPTSLSWCKNISAQTSEC